MKVPMTALYSDGSMDHHGTIERRKFRKAAADGHDWISKLDDMGDGDKQLVALIPIPITPGHQTLRRKESLT